MGYFFQAPLLVCRNQEKHLGGLLAEVSDPVLSCPYRVVYRVVDRGWESSGLLSQVMRGEHSWKLTAKFCQLVESLHQRYFRCYLDREIVPNYAKGMSLGTRIVLFRKQRGMSQGRLAELLNIHQSMVTRWEKDQVQPKQEKLLKLAQIFEVRPEELLSASGDGIRYATQSLDDPKLIELLGQLHRLSGKDLEALKSVLEAMLTRARVQDAIGA